MKMWSELTLPSGAGMPPDAVLCVAESPPQISDAVTTEFLCADELKFFRQMAAVEKRKKEWLLGRIAAKAAVGLHMRRARGKQIVPSGIEILAGFNGKPFVNGIEPRIEISISHSNGMAAAVAWGAESGHAGIDLEFPRKISDAVIADTFSAGELALVGGSKNAIKLWCMKEAASKVTGEGIRFRLQNITVVSLAEMRSASSKFRCVFVERRGALIACACATPS